MKRMLLVALLYLGAGADAALPQSPFFQDKNISVVLGGPPGGSADMRTRAVITILRKHIPGNPNLVMQYMAAGGGRQAANHVYKAAKPDGLTIGSMGLSEPPADAPVVPLADIDCFVLPGLAFDARGARLGWGRGHFDATLEAAPHALRLAWAYDFQVVASVPEAPGDQRVDLIVTDTSVHLTGARPLPALDPAGRTSS